MSDVPNGLAVGCVACHTQNNTPDLNIFGQDVARLSGALPDWSAVRLLDSDADGQSNAQELGDPCATWRKGLTPGRTDNLSNPGRASSTSATPDVPACTAPDAGVPDVGTPDAGARDAGARDAAPIGVDAGPMAGRDAASSDAGAADAGGCRCVGAWNELRWTDVVCLWGLGLGLWLRRIRPQSRLTSAAGRGLFGSS